MDESKTQTAEVPHGAKTGGWCDPVRRVACDCTASHRLMVGPTRVGMLYRRVTSCSLARTARPGAIPGRGTPPNRDGAFLDYFPHDVGRMPWRAGSRPELIARRLRGSNPRRGTGGTAGD